jgi:D-alanyl-D-alanine carboxypeptidase
MTRLQCFAVLCLIVPLIRPATGRAEGLGPETVPAIDKIVAKELEKKAAASLAVGVVKDGRLVLARGYGYADLENDVPATAETVYRLGSITKQFTAMAVMQLAEQGKLSIDDELTKFLPDYPVQGHKVTVRNLLNHTSGIKSYTSLPNFFKRARQELSRDEMLGMFKDEPFDFDPGTAWRYNNSGYYLLGVIIEKASGERYGEYLWEHIFRPLGMSATRYGDTTPIIRHRAQGYRPGLFGLENDSPISMSAPGAAGALVSSVLDLIKWHQALEAGALISAASYESLYQPTKLADGKTQPYGFGWGVSEGYGRHRLGHGGGINGFSTMIARYPDDRLAVIVLSNTAGANVGSVESRIAKVMLGIEDKPPADLPTDEALLRPLVGSYVGMEQRVEITSQDNRLYIKLPGKQRDRLKYQGDQTFVSSDDADVQVKFTVQDGKVAELEIDVRGAKFPAKRVE